MTTKVWADAPGYVMLVGDTTIDPRNFYGAGFFNFVPTRMIDTNFEETGSDEYLSDFDGDGLSEMAMGRIAARNGATITTVFNKTQNWEQGLTATSLNRGGLFACDVPDGYDFCGMNGRLIDQLPDTMPNALVRRGLAPPDNEMQLDPNAQANVIAGITPASYSELYWSRYGGSLGRKQLFCKLERFPIKQCGNESLFTMLTCLNGYFVLPTTNSLAENLFIPLMAAR